MNFKIFNKNTCREIIFYYKDKECTILHRTDGPAIEYRNGRVKEWYINGKRHREGGPAVEYKNSAKEWWVDGKLHRENGPAKEFSSGYKSYYLNGSFYLETDYWQVVTEMKFGGFV